MITEFKLPKKWKVCNCKHPLLENKEEIDSYKIICKICGKSKIFEKEVDFF